MFYVVSMSQGLGGWGGGGGRDLGLRPCELQSKLLKGGYIAEHFRVYQGEAGILAV